MLSAFLPWWLGKCQELSEPKSGLSSILVPSTKIVVYRIFTLGFTDHRIQGSVNLGGKNTFLFLLTSVYN